MGKKRLVSAILLLFGVAGIAWAKGDWNAAKERAEAMKRRQMELRQLEPEEIRNVVTAICAADEDERRDVGRAAAERVADRVRGEFSNLERSRDDAYRAIDDVLGDDELKANHDAAQNLRTEVKERWESIEKMSKNAMRGGNLPLVSWMALKGIEEHQNYQRNSSNCHASEFETGRRRADCLRADGDACYVIELKPNNARAISTGKKQADDSVEDLNEELKKIAKGEGSSVMKKLIEQRSDFAKCKRFEPKLKCYTLCPSVDAEADFRETSVSWSDC